LTNENSSADKTRRPEPVSVRIRLATGFIVACCALALAGCGSTAAKTTHRSAPKIRPLELFAAPKGTIALAPPASSGSVWVLAGNASVKTLSRVDVDTGAILGTFGVSPQATDVDELGNGELALSIANGSSGAVQLIDTQSGKVAATIATSGPVSRIALASDNATIYALESVGANRAVVAIATTARTLGTIYPVPATTVDAVPTIDQTAIWVLEHDGTVAQISSVNKQVTTEFITGAPAGEFAISPTGSTLYVLRSSATAPDVAVVNTTTEAVTKALPAPLHADDLVVSPDGSTLYDAVGDASIGNIQTFPLN